MAVCTCDVSLSNTGRPGCFPVMGVARQLILVSALKADGTENKIDLTDTLNAAYVTAALNNAEPKERWFPVGELLNVENLREDPIRQEFNDGSALKVRDGVKNFTGIIAKQTPDFKRKLDGWACTDFSAYIVDKQGNLIGDGSEAGFLKPIPVNSPTWDARYIETTDTTVPQIQISFQWDLDFDDANLRMLTASDWTGVNLLTIRGLVDLFGAVSNEATTGFTMTITTDYGSVLNREKVTGLVAANFALNEVSPTPATEAFTVVEASDGVYNFTYTTPVASGDKHSLSIDAATTGYDDTNLANVDIDTP